MTSDGFIPIGTLLMREAARFFEIKSVDGRADEALKAKRAVIVVLKDYGWSDRRIANKVHLDRSTVVHHRKSAAKLLPVDPELAAAVTHLKRFLPV